MIARIWHGTVLTAKAQEYCDLIFSRDIPEINLVPGSRGVQVLRRPEGPLTHFVMISYWTDLESIKAFAGEDIDVAKYYPDDRDYLVEFETHVVHYEVVEHGQEAVG